MAGGVSSDAEEYIRSKVAVTPLPWREMVLVSVIHTGQALQMTILLPILVFMIPTFGITSAADVGRYAGFLASLYPLGQFCTSMLWGMISDRTGRRIWMIFGNVVTGVTAILLGLCQSYWTACSVRLANGLLNCTLLVTKSVLAELCDKTNISKGFGLLNVNWGVGAILGSVLGGLLADPCRLYKLEHCPSFLVDFPFILPFIACALVSAVGAYCAFLLPETKFPADRSYSKVATEEYELKGLDGFESIREESYRDVPVTQKQWVEEGVGRVQVISAVYSIDDEDESEGGGPFAPVRETFKVAKPVEGEEDMHEASKPMPLWRMLRDREVLLVTLLYGLMGFDFIYAEELFPIFAAAPHDVGGLELQSSSLGILLGVGGGVTIAYILIFFPTVSRLLGPLRCMKYSIVAFIPVCFAIPACSFLTAVPALEWSILVLCTVCKSVILSTGFTCMMVLSCNAATPDTLGAVTGLGQSVSFFCRTFAPAVGGMVWSFSAKLRIPFHQFVAWLIVAFFTFVTYLEVRLLPKSLDGPRDKDSFGH